jgi:hypothetical protein
MGTKRASGLTPRQREWLGHLRKASVAGRGRTPIRRHPDSRTFPEAAPAMIPRGGIVDGPPASKGGGDGDRGAGGAVRYRLRRLASEAVDGRSEKPFRAEPRARAIEHWMQAMGERGVNLQALYEWLAAEHGYAGNYKAIQRFVRAKYPKPSKSGHARASGKAGAVQGTDSWVAGSLLDCGLFPAQLIVEPSLVQQAADVGDAQVAVALEVFGRESEPAVGVE